MNIGEIRDSARNRMKGFCNVCKECNGIYCSGKVPGMGGTGTGNSMKRNFEMLSKVKLHLKTIHNAVNPDTKTNLWGIDLNLPLIGAPVTGSEINMGGYLTEEKYCESVVKGCVMANTLAMTGDSGNPDFYIAGLNAIKYTEGKGIAIIKPRENIKIIENIKKAEESGALAVGIDIDGAGLITMSLLGQPVGPKSKEDLKEIIKSTHLPVILKGIMSAQEAELAVEVGAKAIVVSNHGGRVLDDALSTVDVLPEIVAAVKGKIIIMADGSVRDGKDIFKYLALGADFVLSARPLIWGAIGGNEEGVKTYIEHMRNGLYQTMILTGAKDIGSIDKSMIQIT